MSSQILLSLGILLIFGHTSNAVDPNCFFQMDVLPGRTYYIASPNYPNMYTGAHSCRWNIRSTSQLRVNCEVFEVPSSTNCALDQVLMYLSPRQGPLRLCGAGRFGRDSDGPEIVVTFQSARNTPGGRFSCYIQAIGSEQNCRCGWKKPMRIVGGENTGLHEFPMMAGIVDARLSQVYCGGTIISVKHILSAAHCVMNRDPSNMGVLIGDYDISTGRDTNSTLFKVSQYVMHPSFRSNIRNSPYDISVITILGTIRYTNEIGPACLPFQHSQDSFSGAVVNILGWGTTEFAGSISNILQKAQVNIINLSQCRNTYPNVLNNQMCTFAPGRDACQFDSGGPALWQNPSTGRLVNVGIISYGIACGTNNPSVNTRVGAFMDWILSVTPGAVYCRAE
ncbi:venom serine protease 34-like isoform X2 [Leptopilina boulardi]|uniref:venom serine protease 34-like isoform X2 n=1 Tax=Leptopilina boulardi TaxID=63433 RepID=UPI0021F5479E|nr:venom serine protease 34-like isoform X2 [Leptopilina boulardi]